MPMSPVPAERAVPARRTLLAAALAAVAACAAAPMTATAWPFGDERVAGSGNVVRQARQVGRFSGIAFGLPGHLELRTGSAESVTVETDDNLQPLVETVVEGDLLRIRPARRNLDLRTKNLRIVVTARQVDRLAVGGPGAIDADAMRGRELRVELGGSGRIDVRDIEGDRLSVSVGGSGELRAGGGKVGRMAISIGGSGDVDLGKVAAERASVSIGGSGDVTVWSRSELRVSIAGSGDVKYYGDPRLSHSIAGSGAVRRLGAAPR